MSASPKIRVVQHCPTGSIKQGWVGGIDVHVFQIMEFLDKERYEVSAVANADDWFKSECDSRGFPCAVIPRGAHLSPRFIWRMADYLRDLKPDLAHIHGMSAGTFYAYCAARLAGVPRIVLTIHTFTSDMEYIPFPVRVAMGMLGRVVFSGVDLIYTVAERQLDDPSLNMAPRCKLTVVPNAIEFTPLPTPTGSELRAEFGIAEDELIAITVARLDRQKSHRYLLDAVPAVARARPKMRFLIVGDGPLKEDLLAQRSALGIGERVIFAGFRKDVPRLLAGADLFVLSSLFEGMPAAILESMRAGLPTVATAVNGIPELVGDTGILVSPKRPDELARALIEITSDLERMRELGRAARKRIEDHFSIPVYIRKVEAVYERVLNGEQGQYIHAESATKHV